jgi:hypothetical protein
MNKSRIVEPKKHLDLSLSPQYVIGLLSTILYIHLKIYVEVYIFK